MADRVPDRDQELLSYTANLVTVWQGGQAGVPDIGVTDAQVAALAGSLDTAQDSFDQAVAIRSQSKAITGTKRTSIAALRQELAGLIDTVEAYAKTTNDPAVYQRAHLDPPSPPNPVPPVNPSNLVFALAANGGLEMSWDGRTVSGTSYLIDRALQNAAGQTGSFVRVATATARTWTDTSVPAGTQAAIYRVSALKGETQTPGVQNTAHFTFVFNGNGEQELDLAAA